jgi:RNA polymerase sigma factor (sigma-70 family)
MLAVREWDRERARDIRQKTLLQVLVNLNRSGTIQCPDQFAAYVMGVFRNKLREEIRDRIKHPQSPEMEPVGTGTSAEDEFVNARNKERTSAVLREMPDRDRRVIQLLFLEEAEREEACRQLGVDRGALRVRLARATQRFRDSYLKRYGGPP